MNTLGLLFGSFDPIHNGHIQIAQWALANDCREVWFIAQPTNAYKSQEAAADYTHRLAMIHAAIEGLPELSVFESDPGVAPSHIITETMRQLSHTERKLRLIVGEDLGNGVEQWPDYHEISRRASIIVHPRFDDLSSAAIRDKVASGSYIDSMVPPAVASYISHHLLYRS